jgi:hypothetical protein
VPSAVFAGLLLLAAVSPASAETGTRIPVNSTDDPASPTANRIDAVTNIVEATNARLERVASAYPPNPCADITEPTAFCDAAIGAFAAYLTLGQSVADACAAEALDGPGDAVITDADVYASDMSATGLANQLTSIVVVLGNADDRLGGILVPNPGPPEAPVTTALGVLYAAIADGGTVAGGLLHPPDPGFEYPPNPCVGS